MDPLIFRSISKLSDAVIYVARTTANFNSELQQLKKTLDRIKPIIVDIQNQNRILHRTSSEQAMFIDELKEADELVRKCLTFKKRDYIKKFKYSLKLKAVNQKLLRFFQIEVQAVQCRDIKETLAEVTYVNERITSLALDVEHLGQTLSGGSMAVSSERKRFGWPVPSPPKVVVGFDKQLEELKIKVLSDDDKCVASKVVVVSAAGGFGKTTLVKKLCNDPEIKDHFGDNVFFVTVSEAPNFIASVNDLINSQQVNFQGTEDAKNKLENFLRKEVSGPVLLVLDDVWHASYIKNFEFDIEGYKLLVTSRMIFTEYDVFKFDPLSDEDAKVLFHKSAEHIRTINENLVAEMVKYCKKHPLTLSVVGRSLNRKDEVVWRSKLKSLSQGQSVLDTNKEVLNLLERSINDLENEFKQCYLDFGLFPEDKRIPASALLDMWAHLYNHDDEGIDTLAKIFELSYRNLVDFIPIRELENGYPMVNYCEGQYVTQHDLLRQLAINLNSKLPIEKRERLIINEQNGILVTNVQGEDHITSIEQMKGPMQARILSVSTGESFSSRWCYMRVPEVEVMVMNLRSRTFTLPPFLKEMQKLKILNVTKYGFPAIIEGFHLLGCLSNLTVISFEHVRIPSLSRSTFELVNLQKLSFITCDIADAFEELNIDNLNVWPSLVELEMVHCYGLEVYPRILCSSVYLRKLRIIACFNLCRISKEISNLTSLETLSLRACEHLKKLPESITRLQKLSIIDISYCSLNKLPEQMGSLSGLRTIYMTNGFKVFKNKLPSSVKSLSNTKVICDGELARLWKEFPNVEVNVVDDETTLLERIID